MFGPQTGAGHLAGWDRGVGSPSTERGGRQLQWGWSEGEIQEFVEQREREALSWGPFVFARVCKGWRKAQLKVGAPLRTRVESDISRAHGAQGVADAAAIGPDVQACFDTTRHAHFVFIDGVKDMVAAPCQDRKLRQMQPLKKRAR